MAGFVFAGAGALAAQPVPGPAPVAPGAVEAPTAAAGILTPAPRWVAVRRDRGHLVAAALGLVINTSDPYSLAVGEHYIAARHLQPHQVLRLPIPLRARLTPAEFEDLRRHVAAYFGPDTQALALAWRQPFAVDCNSITAALTLGFDKAVCAASCGRSRPSPYFDAATAEPWRDLGLRPSMLLAAGDVASALRMIDRGVAADHRLTLSDAPAVRAWFETTDDPARNVRATLFPPPSPPGAGRLEVRVGPVGSEGAPMPLILHQTGAVRVAHLQSLPWADGALADHLTSFGGVLDGKGGQMPVTDWIDAGATASYGSVSEPCARPQKFPHPQVLLLHYLQGATAIEAYWKSVAWPQQGLFVGEPLAAPFAAFLPFTKLPQPLGAAPSTRPPGVP